MPPGPWRIRFAARCALIGCLSITGAECPHLAVSRNVVLAETEKSERPLWSGKKTSRFEPKTNVS